MSKRDDLWYRALVKRTEHLIELNEQSRTALREVDQKLAEIERVSPDGGHTAIYAEEAREIIAAALVRPRGEATLGDNPTKEEVAEYLRHHQALPDHLVRSPRGEATDESRDESR